MKTMIIPAAGRGSRLNFDGPKCLYPVSGKPLLSYLINRYKPIIEHFVLVVNPQFELAVDEFMQTCSVSYQIEYQYEPTGMLDAILEPLSNLDEQKVSQVWITWCDQIAISQQTANALNQIMSSDDSPEMAMPTLMKANPYIHLQRDEHDKITKVLHRREGDQMPEVGENDCGLFALSNTAYFKYLIEFSQNNELLGGETQERNFLPFIAWLDQRHKVETFAAQNASEAIGINTVDDAQSIVDYLD